MKMNMHSKFVQNQTTCLDWHGRHILTHTIAVIISITIGLLQKDNFIEKAAQKQSVVLRTFLS